MKIPIFVPFGSHSQEAGLIYLLANYLKATYPEVVQLRCNGMFSTCDRDVDSSWTRTMTTCFACIADQRALSDWSGLPVQEFSAYVTPDDTRETKQWATSLDASQLPQAEFRGMPVSEMCRETFANRFGVSEFEPRNKSHEQFLRKLLVSAARAGLAAQRYHSSYSPDLCLVSGGKDYVTQSFVALSQALKRDVAVFRWDVASRAIHITHPRSNKTLSCELVPEGVLGMRSDYKTWPNELLAIVQGILSFLEIAAGQLKLPISK
ncbi:MAG: hypothetical protein J0M12_08300 [Deltaproteobacteria bacterium]|nr:hypothetical protein [Deltaproteobacteria bacterium]